MPSQYNIDNLEKLLNDIQSLQDIEQKLFNSLDDNTLLTSEQQDKILKRINQISEMRLNLYKTLGGINTFYQTALNNSQDVYNQQKQAVRVVERQLNENKKKLAFLEKEKNNKIRLIQINDYFGQKYNEHASLMKYVIYMLIPIIIVCIIYNLGLLPTFLFYALIIVIAVIGSLYIIFKFISIWNRDNMNYQSYDWNFNLNAAPKADNNASLNNPWDLPDVNLGLCIGNSCCSPGTIYDREINKCISETN
jgi:hypothetical protein